jgi:hypothetical protein
MAEETAETSATKLCNACGSPLHLAARLCPVCKTWQTPWKNWLQYWAIIASMITLAGSAVTFAVTHFRTAPPPEISLAILDLTNPGSLNVLNTGNVDVLITDVRFSCMPYGFIEMVPVEKVVKHGEVLTFAFERQRPDWPAEATTFVDPAKATELLKTASTGGYFMAFYTKGHSSLSFLKHLEGFKSADAVASVFYVPTAKAAQRVWQQVSVDVPLEGVLMKEKPPFLQGKK